MALTEEQKGRVSSYLDRIEGAERSVPEEGEPNVVFGALDNAALSQKEAAENILEMTSDMDPENEGQARAILESIRMRADSAHQDTYESVQFGVGALSRVVESNADEADKIRQLIA